MSDNRTIQLAEIPIGGKGGDIWNRLHGEREELCESLAGTTGPNSYVYCELMQARLRKIDDALDRLMSGSFGICSQCGQPINKIKLDIDPATSLCLDCSATKPESVASSSSTVRLESLNPFDTILMRTHNSEYRILLLDPITGRALVEGGRYLLEPSEGLVKGSARPGFAFNAGEISVGSHLEMWIHEQVFLTSPIETVEVKHNPPTESLESISATLHGSIA